MLAGVGLAADLRETSHEQQFQSFLAAMKAIWSAEPGGEADTF